MNSTIILPHMSLLLIRKFPHESIGAAKWVQWGSQFLALAPCHAQQHGTCLHLFKTPFMPQKKKKEDEAFFIHGFAYFFSSKFLFSTSSSNCDAKRLVVNLAQISKGVGDPWAAGLILKV